MKFKNFVSLEWDAIAGIVAAVVAIAPATQKSGNPAGYAECNSVTLAHHTPA